MNQIENFALSRECSTLKNAPVFFLFSSLLHFSSGSTMYIGRTLRARAKRANFFEKNVRTLIKLTVKFKKIQR